MILCGWDDKANDLVWLGCKANDSVWLGRQRYLVRSCDVWNQDQDMVLECVCVCVRARACVRACVCLKEERLMMSKLKKKQLDIDAN